MRTCDHRGPYLWQSGFKRILSNDRHISGAVKLVAKLLQVPSRIQQVGVATGIYQTELPVSWWAVELGNGPCCTLLDEHHQMCLCRPSPVVPQPQHFCEVLRVALSMGPLALCVPFTGDHPLPRHDLTAIRDLDLNPCRGGGGVLSVRLVCFLGLSGGRQPLTYSGLHLCPGTRRNP